MNEICSPHPWGVFEDGFLTTCFTDLILAPIPSIFLFIFGCWRCFSLCKKPSQYRPYTKAYWFQVVATSLIVLAPLADLVYIGFTGTDMPTYKLISDIVICAGWLFSLAIILMEHMKGQKHSWIVITFWVCEFLVGGIRLQVLAKNLDQKGTPFELYETICYFVLEILLCFSALLFNKVPKVSEKKKDEYERLLFDDEDKRDYGTDSKYALPKDKGLEERANIFSKTIFWWMNPLLRLGYRRALTHEDLPPVPKKIVAADQCRKFERQWRRQLQKEKPSLISAIARAFGFHFFLAGLLKLGNDVGQFVGPILLEQLVLFIKDKNAPLWKGAVLSLGMLLGAIFTSVCLHQYFNNVYIIGLNIRSSIIDVVYRKAFRISHQQRQKSTVGEIVNLQSIDAQRICDTVTYLHMLWSAPLQIIISIVLLWRVVSYASLGGLATMVVILPFQLLVGKILGNIQKFMMKQKDKRTKIMNEILQGIRVIKFFAWEMSFIEKVNAIRTVELRTLRKSALLRAFMVLLWSVTPLLVAIVTFTIYVLSSEDHILTAERAFTALSLFNIMRFPLNMLPMIITAVIEALVSVRRLRDYLVGDELDPDAVRKNDKLGENAVVLKGASFNWGGERDVLKKLTFSVPKGKLVAIVGPVGAGKSSLLSAILGEMPKNGGEISIEGRIAYIPQQAWIQNATVKENILFGREFDDRLYRRTVRSTELEADLAILPAGDNTEIGEKGINLSGGQKQRISTARAVYQEADIYLLDDPLSAVDAHVGKAIFVNCLKQTLGGTTRILVTHQLQFLSQADHIIVLKDGEIEEQGTYEDLMKAGLDFASLIDEHVNEEEKEEGEGEGEVADPESPRKGPEAKDSKKDTEEKAGEKLIQKEGRDVGGVKLSVYNQYIMAIGGYFFGFLIIFLFATESALSMGANYWLSHWSNIEDNINTTNPNTTSFMYALDGRLSEEEQKGSTYYLMIYGFIGLATAFSSLFRAVAIAIAGVVAAKGIHNKMLKRVMYAPTSLFDTTPIGRILNRFGKDQYTIDELLPRVLSMSLSTSMSVISVIIIITSVTPVFLITFVPLSFLYKFIQQYYLRSSRELKRLDSISKSPIFALFSETLSGLSTIRAYEKVASFVSLNEKRIDRNNQAYYLWIVSNRWLGVRLEVIGGFVVFGAAFFAVLERNSIDPGLAGLSITYALQLTGSLNWLVRMSTEVENNLISVERCVEYSNLPIEAPPVLEFKPPSDWPKDGAISFEKLEMRYRPELPLVLKGVSAAIEPSEKIGVVGRTGAGKSSLMLGLFRIVEAARGRIVIDGIDISQIGLKDLRSRLAIIPQDPTLFTGTIRENLDPFSQHTDEQVWASLEAVHLEKQVQEMEGTLEAPVTEFGENLSVGTRQLMCLARALLRKAKILVMDEATASVDFKTDALIQQTIRKEFKDCTVLTIAHRVHTIIDSDRVMVLDKGKLIEFEKPDVLLANKDSVFYSLVNQSGTKNKEKGKQKSPLVEEEEDE